MRILLLVVSLWLMSCMVDSRGLVDGQRLANLTSWTNISTDPADYFTGSKTEENDREKQAFPESNMTDPLGSGSLQISATRQNNEKNESSTAVVSTKAQGTTKNHTPDQPLTNGAKIAIGGGVSGVLALVAIAIAASWRIVRFCQHEMQNPLLANKADDRTDDSRQDQTVSCSNTQPGSQSQEKYLDQSQQIQVFTVNHNHYHYIIHSQDALGATGSSIKPMSTQLQTVSSNTKVLNPIDMITTSLNNSNMTEEQILSQQCSSTPDIPHPHGYRSGATCAVQPTTSVENIYDYRNYGGEIIEELNGKVDAPFLSPKNIITSTESLKHQPGHTVRSTNPNKLSCDGEKRNTCIDSGSSPET